MSMPEAAVNENNRFVLRENQIRFSGHLCAMKAIPIALGMEVASYLHLGLCIFTLDAAHVVTAGLGGVNIHDAL